MKLLIHLIKYIPNLKKQWLSCSSKENGLRAEFTLKDISIIDHKSILIIQHPEFALVSFMSDQWTSSQ